MLAPWCCAGSWQLRATSVGGDDVATESGALSLHTRTEADRRAVSACRQRIENDTCPAPEGGSHDNPWLGISEALSAIEGVLVFRPFDGSFL